MVCKNEQSFLITEACPGPPPGNPGSSPAGRLGVSAIMKGNALSSTKHSRKFTIKQPIEILFPLFSAEGEKLWVPGWEYENVMESTDLHEDYIFLTQNHDHASSKAIWLVKRYDPDTYFVQFYKVEPNDKVGIISVQCFRIDKLTTEVEITYHYIGISEKGNEFIKQFTFKDYKAFIDEWQKLLLAYFESMR